VDYTHVLLPEGFQHHIFITAGRAICVRMRGIAAGPPNLETGLSLLCAPNLGRRPRFFLDTETSRSGALKRSLEKVLESTALLLFVVSPGSCRSPWCRWEVQRFLDIAWSPASRNDTPLPDDRIVGVTL